MNSAFEAELYVHAIATEREAARRYAELAERMAQQDPPADHTWRMQGSDALEIALQAEKAARAFFEQAARTAAEPLARALAMEMAAQESAHAALIGRMAARP